MASAGNRKKFPPTFPRLSDSQGDLPSYRPSTADISAVQRPTRIPPSHSTQQEAPQNRIQNGHRTFHYPVSSGFAIWPVPKQRNLRKNEKRWPEPESTHTCRNLRLPLKICSTRKPILSTGRTSERYRLYSPFHARSKGNVVQLNDGIKQTVKHKRRHDR